MNRTLALSTIAYWQPRLGLADWDVRISDGAPKDANRAEVEGWVARRMAVIRIAADAPDAALPRLVVHELLHLWLNQLLRSTDMLTRHTPPAVDAVFSDRWDELEHQLIHALEGALTGDAYIAFGDSPEWTDAWREDAA